MQTDKNVLYQCSTCNKRFPCKPSLDRHSIDHDLEEFASWTKVENISTTSMNPHIPPHKKLVNQPIVSEMNGRIDPVQGFIKSEPQQSQPCVYNQHPQFGQQDLVYQQKQAMQHHHPAQVTVGISVGVTASIQESTGNTENQITKTDADTDSKNLGPKKKVSHKKKNPTPRDPSIVQIKERSYFCDLCSRSYTRRDHLNRHKLVHTGDRPFICSVCLKSFMRKDKLQRHEKIHVKDFDFSCQICGKGFGRKDGLNKHYMAHKMGTVSDPKKKESPDKNVE